MTNEQPPRGRFRPRPRGFDDVPELSDEEVERRVGVRGGAAPRVPIERAPRPTRPARREERTTARDSLLLVGLVVVGLVAVRVFLPEGPLTAAATASPSGSQAAVITSAPTASTAPQTIVPVITLPPGSPSPSPLVEPTVEPTVAAPTPTLKPGETPRPTPKPTAKPTAAPTPGPTANNRATVLVKMVVITDSGGSTAADPSDWTIHVAVEGGLTATPNDFPGLAAGTSVSIPAGKGFTIKSNNARTDFAAYPVDAACAKAYGGGGLAAGASVTCTITRDDRPRINVTVNVNGGGPSTEADVRVTITGAEASPPGFDGSGQVVVGFGLTYSITASSLADYTSSGPVGADCSGTMPLNGSSPGTCTFTYDYVPPPSPASMFPPMFLAFLRPRRWPTTATG